MYLYIFIYKKPFQKFFDSLHKFHFPSDITFLLFEGIPLTFHLMQIHC